MEFEPTVSQSPIVRPETKSQIANQQNNSASNANANKPNQNASSESGTSTKPVIFDNTLLSDILLIVISLLIIGLMIFAFRRYRLLNQVPVYLSNGLERIGMSTPLWINNWIHWNQMTSVEHSFASINLSLRWLGSPQPISATAAERAAELAKLLPSAKDIYRNGFIGASIRALYEAFRRFNAGAASGHDYHFPYTSLQTLQFLERNFRR